MTENLTPTIVILCLFGVLALVPFVARPEGQNVGEGYGRREDNVKIANDPRVRVFLGHDWPEESSLTRSQGEGRQSSPGMTSSEFQIGPVYVNARNQSLILTMINTAGQVGLKGEIGIRPEKISKYEIYRNGMKELHIRIPNTEEIIIKLKDKNCVQVSRRAMSCVSEALTDCFHLGSAHWYGGAEIDVQQWPLEKAELPLAPYLARVNGFGNVYGPIQERWFFNSAGAGICIEEDVPLFISLNETGDKMLCLQAKYDNRWYVSQNNTLPELNYTMCMASNVRIVHELMADRFIKRPKETPSHDVFRYPIWTTWAQYKTDITQAHVEEFVKEIIENNFSISQVEIDDGWASTYGDMDFHPLKFPNPKKLIDFVHSHNASVTLWVHPFINIEAEIFRTAALANVLLHDVSGKSPALTWWWHGNTAGHIDFSNPEGVKFFLAELDNLRTKYGVDSFKFDAGDVSFLPSMFQGHQQFLNKNEYTRLYALAAHEADAELKRLEVRTGARTQDLPAFVRMLDRSSTWSLAFGLKSVITTGLFVGIIGYPFLLPDLIAGNSYSNQPDPELFIRWVQANALMPVMQFSLLPWATNNSTVLEVSQEMVKLHEKYADLIIDLANQSITTGYPIMRPLWWIAPTDEAALTVDDQFLIGDDLLVAPVVNQGETIRKLYLPAGKWLDELKGNIFSGGKWINYPVTLKDLPYFTKVTKK